MEEKEEPDGKEPLRLERSRLLGKEPPPPADEPEVLAPNEEGGGRSLSSHKDWV